jgi:putative sigma-54 modulation protein
MQVQFTFRQVDSSTALREYTQEQLERIERFLLCESRWQVHFSMGRYDCQVDVTVSGPWGYFRATGCADDFYHAVDLAAEKLGRQFQKRKEQLQSHKKPERSREGRLDRVNEALEYDNSPYFHLKRSA